MYTKISRKAFTLIELLIVIAIIALLTVAFLPQIRGAQGKARDAGRRTGLDNITAAIESFGRVPATAAAAGGEGCLDFSGAAGTPGGDIMTQLTNRPQVNSAGGVTLCSGGYYYRPFESDGSTIDGAGDTAFNYVVIVEVEDLNRANVSGAAIVTLDAATVAVQFTTLGDARTRIIGAAAATVRLYASTN